jgi:GAF domain-containing protein
VRSPRRGRSPDRLVYADSRKPGASFGELDVEILEALAAHAALAIVMARADRELKGLASRLPEAAAELDRSATSWASVLAEHAARTKELS